MYAETNCIKKGTKYIAIKIKKETELEIGVKDGHHSCCKVSH